LLEKSKLLYVKLPKLKEAVFSYPLNWNSLFNLDVIEKVGRPWIAKKVKEYLGVEEASVISHLIKVLN